MVGGPESKFEEAKKLLSLMGKNVVHCGPVGTGQVSLLSVVSDLQSWFMLVRQSILLFQAAKICNNMLLGISMIGASETMNLGIK